MLDERSRLCGETEAVGSDLPISVDRTPTNSGSTCPVQEFCIDNADRANWLVRRVIEARAYRERVRVWAEKEERRAVREERELLHRFGSQLQRWVTSELGRSKGRRKSISLPAGVVGFRQIGAKLLIDDPAVALDWARRNCPQAVMTRQILSKSALKEHLVATGEVPDVGVSLEPVRQSFFVR